MTYYTVDEEDSVANTKHLVCITRWALARRQFSAKYNTIQNTDVFLTSWDCCEGQEKQDLHGFQVRASKELLQRRSGA